MRADDADDRYAPPSGASVAYCHTVTLCVHMGAILVRDTKDHQRGPVLRFSANAWRRFTTEQTNK